MEKLFFVGIKHSGKTTFAKRIAAYLDYAFNDSDLLIAEANHVEDIRAFYREIGKENFMEKEYEAVRDFIDKESNLVLSLGGGAADNKRLLSLLKNTGKIVYLVREEEPMLEVILKHGIPAFLDPNNLEESFHNIYKKRDESYKEIADLIVDLGPYRDKDETAKYLLGKLKEAGYGI